MRGTQLNKKDRISIPGKPYQTMKFVQKVKSKFAGSDYDREMGSGKALEVCPRSFGMSKVKNRVYVEGE